MAARAALAGLRRAGARARSAHSSARRSSRGRRAGGQVDGPARASRAPRGPEVRAGETLLEPRDAGRLHAVGAEGRHRRLPLLPPRPEAERATSFVTSARIEPGAVEDRPPRDPLPRRARAGRRGEEARRRRRRARAGRASAGPGCPPGTAPGSRTRSNDANWIAAWAPGWGGDRLPGRAPASRSRPGARS